MRERASKCALHPRGGILSLAVAALLCATPSYSALSPNAELCGNGTVEIGEECDDGGICIGGPNAGTPCTSPASCGGGGVCIGGAREGVGCSTNLDCPFGNCVQCKPFGGDGCASNCTEESDISATFIPGRTQGTTNLTAGTSGIVVHSGVINIAIPINGYHTLTIGKEREGIIPVAVKIDSVNYSRISVSGLVCGCSRGMAAKTCGGTLWDAGGIHLSPDCTEGFTAGDSVCEGRYPCAYINGPGNASSGAIGCNGLSAHNIQITQDCGANSEVPRSPLLTMTGAGEPGSAIIVNSTAITAVIGNCVGTDPAMGPDGEFCTEDDDLLASPNFRFTLPATTGTATAMLQNTSNIEGLSLGPYSGTGAPFNCRSLAEGSADGAVLAGVLTTCDQIPLGDLASRSQLAIGLPLATPTPTPTGPTPTPTSTPPLIRGGSHKPSLKRGCQVAWKVLQSTARIDRFGLAANHQTCEDADPGCDFAPELPGLCEFLVQVCLNVDNPDQPECIANGVSEVEVISPNPKNSRMPVVKEILSANRFALSNGLQHLLDPQRPLNGFIYKPPLTAAQRNLCSAPFPVQILVGDRPKASVTLKVRSIDQTKPRGKKDTSTLKLICRSRSLRTN